MKIREALRAGKCRKLLSIAVALGFTYTLCALWETIRNENLNPLDALQKIAFVAAAFSVTAYNLRTRVIDLVLKIDSSPAKVSHATRIARDCGKKLTNLVVLFTMTAAMMGAAGFLPVGHSISKWCACLIFGLFGTAMVNFGYILFAFENLERFTLDDAEERARAKEAGRLLGK